MNTAELSCICKQVRRDIINMTANAGSGHPGGSLSATELMTTLFFRQMRIDPKIPRTPTVIASFSARAIPPPAIMRCWRSVASSAGTSSPTSASSTVSCRASRL